jgi:hypothetical protein
MAWSRSVRFRDCAIPLAVVTLAAAAIGACSDPAEESSGAAPLCGSSADLSYENFAGPFFLSWCTGCHSADLPEGVRQKAPLEVNLDSLEDIRKHKEIILERAVKRADMPPAGGPSPQERQLLGEWLGCGAPSDTPGFDPGPPSDAGGPPKPTGTCAQPRQPLPQSILPRCSATTRACIEQCPLLHEEENEIEDCREACVDADATPQDPTTGVSCSDCVFNELLACAAARGCADQTAFLYCCIEDCVKKQDATCLQTACADDIQAFGYCVGYGPTECVSFTEGPRARCFGP